MGLLRQEGNRISFYWETVLLPRHIAEYVVSHEFFHLHGPHHTPAFWSHL
ncbi:YgjP-like metallopeptidase domain-containing protein [Chromohalobacter israelensis]